MSVILEGCMRSYGKVMSARVESAPIAPEAMDIVSGAAQVLFADILPVPGQGGWCSAVHDRAPVTRWL